jgi:hypothetical protein
MLPGHKIWDFNKKRLVLGYDSMLIVGFESRALSSKVLQKEEISDKDLKELAGNAFSGQVVVGCLLSIFACWPFADASVEKFIAATSATDDCTVASPADFGDICSLLGV